MLEEGKKTKQRRKRAVPRGPRLAIESKIGPIMNKKYMCMRESDVPAEN